MDPMDLEISLRWDRRRDGFDVSMRFEIGTNPGIALPIPVSRFMKKSS